MITDNICIELQGGLDLPWSICPSEEEGEEEERKLAPKRPSLQSSLHLPRGPPSFENTFKVRQLYGVQVSEAVRAYFFRKMFLEKSVRVW